MTDRRDVAIFAERSFERIVTMPDADRAGAFCTGLAVSAGFYGGTCAGYVLPDELDDMRSGESVSEVARAMAAMSGGQS